MEKLQFATRLIHAGLDENGPTGARTLAIHPTAAYRFKDCDYAAHLFELSEPGNIYTRLMNPTSSAFEARMAALYGAVGALATSSGMAAIHLTVTQLAAADDNIVSTRYLYGGTHNLFSVTLPRLGVDCRIVNGDTPEDFGKLIDDRTKAIYIESMGNPTCHVLDIEALAALAHEHGVPLIVDNTFGAGGYLCNPFEHGADIVVDSTTKWINGHGTAMGGIIVDSGHFDWSGGRFPQIDGPSAGYHGLNLREAFGAAAFIVKCRVDGLRDMGCAPSAFDSWLHAQGSETLALRMNHILESVEVLAEVLNNHPRVERVHYVGFEEHPGHANAARYFLGGGAPIFSLELKGDLDTTKRFVDSLKLAKNMTMIGDSVTVVTHPASTTHKQLSLAEQAAAGVTPTLLRISPGLEDVEDILKDFEQAFRGVRSYVIARSERIERRGNLTKNRSL